MSSEAFENMIGFIGPAILEYRKDYRNLQSKASREQPKLILCSELHSHAWVDFPTIRFFC
jgi:hypothetical protein